MATVEQPLTRSEMREELRLRLEHYATRDDLRQVERKIASRLYTVEGRLNLRMDDLEDRMTEGFRNFAERLFHMEADIREVKNILQNGHKPEGVSDA